VGSGVSGRMEMRVTAGRRQEAERFVRREEAEALPLVAALVMPVLGLLGSLVVVEVERVVDFGG
jgi:hypothetical protein